MFCFQSISEIRQEDQGIFLDLILDMNRKFYTMESVEWKNLIILSSGKTVDNQDKLMTESCQAINYLIRIESWRCQCQRLRSPSFVRCQGVKLR